MSIRGAPECCSSAKGLKRSCNLPRRLVGVLCSRLKALSMMCLQSIAQCYGYVKFASWFIDDLLNVATAYLCCVCRWWLGYYILVTVLYSYKVLSSVNYGTIHTNSTVVSMNTIMSFCFWDLTGFKCSSFVFGVCM